MTVSLNNGFLTHLHTVHSVQYTWLPSSNFIICSWPAAILPFVFLFLTKCVSLSNKIMFNTVGIPYSIVKLLLWRQLVIQYSRVGNPDPVGSVWFVGIWIFEKHESEVSTGSWIQPGGKCLTFSEEWILYMDIVVVDSGTGSACILSSSSWGY